MIGEGLRRARNAAYRIASPAEALWRHGSARAALPPLWLRRHTGAVGRFESAARDTAAFLDSLGVVEPGHRVLDVGCGAGAMVTQIAQRIGPEGRYVGFDVHVPSIRWCRRRYEGDSRLFFETAAVASAYGEPSGPPATTYRFPADDGSVDLVLAKSIFTHLLSDDAAHYLAEIRRVLRPGRAAIVTAFLFDPAGASVEKVRRSFPFESPGGGIRWRVRSRPTAAVAWEKRLFESIVVSAGLRLQWLSPGWYPGGDRLDGQDTLLLGH